MIVNDTPISFNREAIVNPEKPAPTITVCHFSAPKKNALKLKFFLEYPFLILIIQLTKIKIITLIINTYLVFLEKIVAYKFCLLLEVQGSKYQIQRS